MTGGAAPHLAVFDLDGTLTRRDTFTAFVVAALRHWPARLLRLPLLLVPLLGFLLRVIDRGGLKGAVLHLLVGGLPRSVLDPFVEGFVRDVVSHGLHSEVPEVLAAHRAAGDRLVLMSASPDLYVPRLARALGMDEALCSAVRWEGERLDGRLAGPNCRDREKTRRLEALRERHPGRAVIAYGNSGADLDHMRRSETAVYVNPAPSEIADLSGEGFRVVRWH